MLRRLVSFVTSRIPSTASVPILRGPGIGLRWRAGSGPPNFYLGTYEKEKVKRFVQALHVGMIVYDVGANAGYYTLLAARHHAAHVYAFEPFPTNFDALRDHISTNGLTECCTPIQAAVGDVDGQVRFQVGRTLCEGQV
jgi:hypothetical protein